MSANHSRQIRHSKLRIASCMYAWFGLKLECLYGHTHAAAASQLLRRQASAGPIFAMDASSERWRFWDFGHRQYVQDTLTGEMVLVHGDGAKFTDGPFKLHVDDNDRPVVVGLLGDDDDCALHFVDEDMANGVTLEGRCQGPMASHGASSLWR